MEKPAEIHTGDSRHITQASSRAPTTEKRGPRPEEVNYQAPMFPGERFATPYFIEFGHEGSSKANVGDYIYALSNNGFWDCGDDMVLGRVERIKNRPAERVRLGVLRRRKRR